MNKPKRVTPSNISKSQNTQKADEFKFPEAKLDLEFFLKKADKEYYPDDLIQEIFGEEGFKMTEMEKVYNVLKAMEDLELVMPFEFECGSCGFKNPVAVEIAKVMKTSGYPRAKFTIVLDDYIFEFDRPEFIRETSGSGLADIGMFMMQWLVGHNQGKDFEFIHLKVGTIVKLATKFAEYMFKVGFICESSCAKCGGLINEEFGVSLDDITKLVNEL